MSIFVEKNKTEKVKFFLYHDPEYNICMSREDKKDLFVSVDFMIESLGKDFNVPILKEIENGQEVTVLKIDEKVIKYDEKNLIEIELDFKRPNHSEITFMLSTATRMDNGILSVDINLYNDIRLKTLLIDWNLKDEDGEKVTLNDENINKLEHRVFQIFVNYLNSKVPLYM